MTRRSLERVGILAVTVLVAWGLLAVGGEQSVVSLEGEEISPVTFVADAAVLVLDDVATQAAKEARAEQVADRYSTDAEKNLAITERITSLFATVRANALVDLPQPVPPPTVEPPPAADVADTTIAPETATLVGQLFLERENGDGFFDPEAEFPLTSVDVVMTFDNEVQHRAETDQLGVFRFSGLTIGAAGVVEIDGTDPDVPSQFVLVGDPTVLVEIGSGENVLEPIGMTPIVLSEEVQSSLLADAYAGLLSPSTIATLVSLATEDVYREAVGLELQLEKIEDAVKQRAQLMLAVGIGPDAIDEARKSVSVNPPVIEVGGEVSRDAGDAAANIVAISIESNLIFDQATTDAERQAARDAEPNVEVPYLIGQTIVEKGDPLTPVHLKAIEELGLNRATGPEHAALVAVLVTVLSLVGIFLLRFRPDVWNSTRQLVLLALIFVLSVLAAKGVGQLSQVEGLSEVSSYAFPAAAITFMVAILFDARVGLLMALPVASVMALAVVDTGSTLFALLSAIAPLPFVSRISTRGDQRRAILFTALAAAIIAAATAWFFHVPVVDLEPGQTLARASLLALGVGLLGSMASVMLLSFFEVIFDVTTTLRLLDVIDRNHPALRLLQEEAEGTFNHSLFVGTLAASAAGAIGANNLLAQAAAYYHDLGKTQNPSYFIENQFGIANPHERLTPEQSVEVIRRHVSDGVELARKYRIPSEVAEGIVSHHGDGVMRYFYDKAKRSGGDEVDVDDYRHRGSKPERKEMAILMMADALEGATRAVFQEEDPSPEKITEVVERIVGEKVTDGQLSNSELTLGELTLVKAAFVDSLIGHYHQRVPYPNFPTVTELHPGTQSPEGSDSDEPGVVEA